MEYADGDYVSLPYYPYTHLAEWEYWIWEDTSAEVAGTHQIEVWAESNSYIWAWTHDYSDVEVYADTEINSSADFTYNWYGPGQSTSGLAEFYYSIYCGSPVSGSPFDDSFVHDYVSAYGNSPAEINLEVASEVIADFWDCPDSYETGSTFDVSSEDNVSNPPDSTYYGPEPNESHIYWIYDEYWYYDWNWQVDIGSPEETCYEYVDEGETVVSLNLSVYSCTYAYSYLDNEYQNIYGENHYYSWAHGFLWFYPDE